MQYDMRRSGAKGAIGLTDHRLPVVRTAASVEESHIVFSVECQFVYLFDLGTQRRLHRGRPVLLNMYTVLERSRQWICNWIQ